MTTTPTSNCVVILHFVTLQLTVCRITLSTLYDFVMPTYKLTYFNAFARAEGIRWVFLQAGEDFEDKRIQQEEWFTLKPGMPFSQLPVLEFDGKILSQSATIGRYLANQFGLAGKDAWEKALADQYVDGIYDFLTALRTYLREENEQKKAAMEKKFMEETAPATLSSYEKFLSSNPSGFLVGDSLTWADLFFGAYMENFQLRAKPEFGKLVENYPKIKANLAKIRNLPNIAAWIKRRPETHI